MKVYIFMSWLAATVFYSSQTVTGTVDVGYNVHALRYFNVDSFIVFSYTAPLTGKAEADNVHVGFLNPIQGGLDLRTGVTIGYTF